MNNSESEQAHTDGFEMQRAIKRFFNIPDAAVNVCMFSEKKEGPRGFFFEGKVTWQTKKYMEVYDPLKPFPEWKEVTEDHHAVLEPSPNDWARVVCNDSNTMHTEL